MGEDIYAAEAVKAGSSNNLRDLCDGYAETRVVAIEKYNNNPGYVPLAKLSDSRMLIGKRRDDVVDELRKVHAELTETVAKQAANVNRLDTQCIDMSKRLATVQQAYNAEVALRRDCEGALRKSRESNALYESDIGKIRQAVGQIYMDKILGPKVAEERRVVAGNQLNKSTLQQEKLLAKANDIVWHTLQPDGARQMLAQQEKLTKQLCQLRAEEAKRQMIFSFDP